MNNSIINNFAQKINEKEKKSNKVTALSSSVTDSQYPSAKAVYDSLPSVPSASSTVPSADTTSGSVGTDTAWARSDHTHPKSSLYADSNKLGDIDYYYASTGNPVFDTDNLYNNDLKLWNKLYYSIDNDKLYCLINGNDYDEIATLNDIPSLTNYVQKSQTNGLLKNDGSIAESISIEDTTLFNVMDCINNNFNNFNGEIVFHDDCSSDMSSQYSTRGHTKEGTYPITITYISSKPSYILSASGGESFTWFVIPNLQGLDNIRITATCMVYAPGQYTQIFLGLCDTLEQTNSSDYKFDFVRIRGDDRLDGVKNDIEQFSNNVFVSYRNVKLVFERIGNNITGKVYDVEYGGLLSWNSYTTTNEYDNPYYFLGLMSKYNAQYILSELKAEQLII